MNPSHTYSYRYRLHFCILYRAQAFSVAPCTFVWFDMSSYAFIPDQSHHCSLACHVSKSQNRADLRPKMSTFQVIKQPLLDPCHVLQNENKSWLPWPQNTAILATSISFLTARGSVALENVRCVQQRFAPRWWKKREMQKLIMLWPAVICAKLSCAPDGSRG